MNLLQTHYPWQDELQQELLRSDTVGPTLLIAGPAGVGKRELAEALARRHLCSEEGDVQCQCRSCRLWRQGSHPDLLQIAPPRVDGSIGIAQVREATDFIHISASVSPHRVLVFVGADRLTRSAANALLKTLEEPPSGSAVVLTAVQASLLLPTVRSRIAEHSLRPPPHAEAVAWCLQQGASVPEDELSLLLQLVGGGPLAVLEFAAAAGKEMLETILPQIDEILHGRHVAVSVAEDWEKRDCREPALLLLRHLAACAAAQYVGVAVADEVQTAGIWRQCVERASGLPLRVLCDLELSGRKALNHLRGGGGLNKKWLLVGLLAEWQRQAAVL